MTLTIELQPEIERNLLAQAQAKGISLADLAKEVLMHAAEPVGAQHGAAEQQGTPLSPPQAANLYDLLTPVRGILTDEEIDQYFARTPSSSRPVES
jgi:hypothetical protein